MLRFHIPLIELNVRISRIGLSDEIMLSPTEGGRTQRKAGEPVLLPQTLVRKAHVFPGAHLVLTSQPLAQPPGWSDRITPKKNRFQPIAAVYRDSANSSSTCCWNTRRSCGLPT